MKHLWLAGLSLCVPGTVFAESAASPVSDTSISETSTFTAADFTQFAPKTALDMVSRIPGFRISGGDQDEEARGFGQASENVLINRRRISSKSTSARDALARIPAANVEKIEIIDGATLDIPGLSGQVVNVTAQANGISGTWSYRQRYREDLPPAYDFIELSLNGEQNNLSWGLTLASQPGRGAGAGRENITNGARQLIEYREEEVTFIEANPKISANLTWSPDNGHIANLNGEFAFFEFDNQEHSNVFRPDGTEFRQTVFQFSEDEWNSEVSGDYEFDLGPGRLKLIGLQRNEHSPTRARFFGGDRDGSNRVESIFDQAVDESESILRTEFSYDTNTFGDWQFSLEGALNTLDADASFRQLDSNNLLIPIDIGDPDIKVEERRAEIFITHGHQVLPKVRVQASLGTEVSEIMSDGANGQTRQFTRPKGFVSVAWQANEDLTINTKVERLVGQLNFFDFVSNIDVNQGDNQTGNIDIVPEQSWRAELEAERDFGDWGAVTTRVFGESLEDIADQVPIGTGEGPGNIDTGTRYGIEIEGTLKFDKFGWEGARLEFEANYNKSAIDDPVTGVSRRINGDQIQRINLQFRHDIPKSNWAWGINFDDFEEAPTFRLNSQRSFEATPGFAWGFIEHKDIFGMTGTAFYGNLTDQDDQFTRVVYDTDRNGAIDRIEDRSRNFGGVLTLRLKGSF